MTTLKVTFPQRFVIMATLALLPNLCFGRPEFFARPVAQYTWLPASARNVDFISGWSWSHGGGGASIPGPKAKIDNYTLSNGGLGGGLAVGVVLGKNRQFEISAEATLTRYHCTYVVTPLPYYTYSPSGPGSSRVDVEPGPAYSGSCTVVLRTVLATFRWYPGKTEDPVRPYLGCVWGSLDPNFRGKKPPTGFSTYDDRGSEDYRVATGLSSGVIIKLGRKTYAEAGYRFLCSSKAIANKVGSNKGLYGKAHMINLALNQRF